MSQKNRRQFGIWMDTNHATIVGRREENAEIFEVLQHLSYPDVESRPSEHTTHNAEQGQKTKFFKEIAFTMQNAIEVHITGTGTIQEQFIKYLSQSPQFKNVVTNETTAQRMTDEKLVEFIAEQFQ